MRYLSVCSGIEAASVAWGSLGWQAAAFSEIEPFPCAVLAHHYPDVPNLGDMTTITQRILNGEVEAPDVLAGGTPCQAFSVAGLRKSLADERGNLTLKFVEIADAIDSVRVRDGRPPAIVFWENVPGVLSTKDNAFGCFLGALAGEDCELKPPGKRWADAGCVFGPQRAIAWRVLDAQYFGLAQRRRRVFVVASARKGFDPAAVLFEFDGVRRDTAPSREARQTAPTIPARSSGCGGLGTDFACDEGLIAHILRGEGFDASEDGTGRGTPMVPVAFQSGNLVRGAGSRPSADVFPTLKADHGRGLSDQHPCVAVAFHPTQDPIGSSDGSTHALGCGSTGGQASVAVAFDQHYQPSTTAQTLIAGGSGGRNEMNHPTVFTAAMQVRRLTPEECEALQGFPRSHTAIPWRGNPASECPDGPRYRALGNSWAVNCARWIGERIEQVEAILGAQPNQQERRAA